jgi:hypothetical protein
MSEELWRQQLQIPASLDQVSVEAEVWLIEIGQSLNLPTSLSANLQAMDRLRAVFWRGRFERGVCGARWRRGEAEEARERPDRGNVAMRSVPWKGNGRVCGKMSVAVEDVRGRNR